MPRRAPKIHLGVPGVAVRRMPVAPAPSVETLAPTATSAPQRIGYVRLPYVRMPGLRTAYVNIRYVRMAG